MATLIFPFPSLSGDDFISRGSGGQVFAVSRDIVFKCPTLFENPAPSQANEMAESVDRIKHERAIHEKLQKYRHRNIVHSILCIPEGFFMQRLDTTLQLRLSESYASVDGATQLRWMQEITSGAAWLENLGLVHGDLRPANVLVDANDHLRLTDFDCTVTIGEPLLVSSEPFCKLNTDLELPPAGPQTEQFSLGSCFYTIRFGHIPLHELDAPSRVRALANNEYPSTSQDVLCGNLIQACWQGIYSSIESISAALKDLDDSSTVKGPSPDDIDQELLLRQCNEFLEIERQLMHVKSSFSIPIGSRWNDWHSARVAVHAEIVRLGQSYSVVTSSRWHWYILCLKRAEQKCEFRIRLRRIETEDGDEFHLRVYEPHTCDSATHLDFRTPKQIRQDMAVLRRREVGAGGDANNPSTTESPSK